MIDLARIRESFLWRIESITPTERPDLRRFRRMVRPQIDPTDMSGAIRLFTVEWLGSDGDTDLTCGTHRTAPHIFGVTVYYASSLKPDDEQNLILSDRDDIIKALSLSSTDTRKGYSDTYSATDIGIMSRDRIRDEIQTDAEMTAYKASWRVIARESV